MMISSVLRETSVSSSRVRNCLYRSGGINFVVSSETPASSVSREMSATSVSRCQFIGTRMKRQVIYRVGDLCSSTYVETYRGGERNMMGFTTPLSILHGGELLCFNPQASEISSTRGWDFVLRAVLQAVRNL
ncbi:hypothetical protein DY000_02053464 [Brassica cretica]|uniref:Uncharacterized protein n=1 Tax=Brassica cretica TaxID=69181 RepID=A0ABQ7AL02_BRACR|nr:hypothetical protein DY000_02053464 [Brassica cretica]